jgi:hypothetical protein
VFTPDPKSLKLLKIFENRLPNRRNQLKYTICVLLLAEKAYSSKQHICGSFIEYTFIGVKSISSHGEQIDLKRPSTKTYEIGQ